MKIEWFIDVPIPDAILEKMALYAEKCTVCEGICIPCSATVRLCDDDQIAQVNAKYRGINRSTDVLSFPAVAYPAGKTAGECEKALRREFDDETCSCFLGDIIIAVPHIYAQAEEYGHSVEREACYLLVHGLCHLMGYDHMEDADKKKMRELEERILSANTNDPAKGV